LSTLELRNELMDSIWWDEAASSDLHRSELAAEDVGIEFAATEVEHLGHLFDFEEQLDGGLKLLTHLRSVGGRVSRTTRYQQSQ
jgi:hypothetical protein